MRTLVCVAGLAAVLVLSGCAGFVRAPISPGMGLVFSDYKMPLDSGFGDRKVTEKVGKATTENILGVVVVGDSSIEAAAAEGNITTIHHVDYHFWNILGIYSKFTTLVYGD